MGKIKDCIFKTDWPWNQGRTKQRHRISWLLLKTNDLHTKSWKLLVHKGSPTDHLEYISMLIKVEGLVRLRSGSLHTKAMSKPEQQFWFCQTAALQN